MILPLLVFPGVSYLPLWCLFYISRQTYSQFSTREYFRSSSVPCPNLTAGINVCLNLRFCFDGLQLGHVVGGDVALGLRGLTPGEPPVTLKEKLKIFVSSGPTVIKLLTAVVYECLCLWQAFPV